jgi:replication factor C subunit 2/4
VCSLCVPVSVSEGRAKEAQAIIVKLWNDGYAATDIIQTLFRVSHMDLAAVLSVVGCLCFVLRWQVTRTMDLPEPVKLEYIREIGFTHMRIAEGLNTKLQLLGCIGRLCLLRPQQ